MPADISVRSLRKRFALLLLILVSSPTVWAAPPEAAVIDIGSRRELLVDKHLIDKTVGEVRLHQHHPIPREASITHNEPWEGSASGYPTILRDGDVYRMYYRGHRYIVDDKGLRHAQPEVTCYAESKDGIHWEKPNLGIVAWKGSKENNIIWNGVGVHNFAPFLDTNPNCAADARYKAVGGTHRSGLHAFKSPDGVHWSKLSDGAVFTNGAFDSHNTVFWDSARGRYALYLRYFSEGNFKGRRCIAVAYSDDVLHWDESQPLSYGDSPLQQMYTNGVLPYYRAPHLLVGFPTRYIARSMTEHAKRLDPVQLRDKLTRALPRAGSDLTDSLFMSSRDGVTFRRWDEAFIRPGPQLEGRWIYGDNYQSYGLVETKSATGGPDEISFYLSEGAWRDGQAQMRRYTLRLDGFISAHATFTGGEIVTKPLKFEGKQLSLNYSSSAAGSLHVEIQDDTGKPLPGFALTDCLEHFGDSVSQTVRWEHGTDVSRLAGQTVRLRFVLKDADLYSFQFQP